MALPDEGVMLCLPGIALRQARAAGGLSVEDLAAQTCIPRRYLLALEADDYTRLPDPVYVRGYLRRCAALLDGDAERWVADFDLQYRERCGDGSCRQMGRRDGRGTARGWRMLGGVLGGLLVAAGSLAAWLKWR
ncbi:MAG TPA: helix-turn-helix domain-containing protein [Porticoccaceae bacterium]|nr:helix-turn-helix domain-containing protein [Porticoccaceae bacterium]